MNPGTDVACHIPFNEDGVEDIVESIADEASKNLVRLAIASARMRFVQPTGMTDTAFQAQLPLSPFDMSFFASVMKSLFTKKTIITRICNGETVAGASDWDV